MSHSWIFQPNKYWFGWDETGLSIFGGQPLRSLVREVVQNSLDAKAEGKEVVKVRFELATVNRSAVPDIDTLEKVMVRCEEASEGESENTIAEVRSARKYSERMNFPVLICTDFGTTGMAGPFERGRPFFTYMNSKGSSPGDANRAGSHGHGKDAPLVNSALRTIFASSTYLDEAGDITHLAQGKCVLMSHFQDEDQFENIGRWGNSDMTPVTELQAQFGWINPFPDRLGTTISILGFNGKGEDWISEMVGHALINYFPAFVKGCLELEFKEGANEITLNHENFTQYLTSQTVKAALEKVDGQLVQELSRTAYFVSAMMTERGGKLRDQQGASPLNLVHFYLTVSDDAPRSYCLIRRNMKICESIPKLQRVPSKYSNFAMVIECESDEANGLIRSMEPSEHDRIDLARLKEKRSLGEKLWTLLKEKWTAVMEQEALPDQKVDGQVDFLAKFFPDLANEDEGVSFEDEDGLDGDRIEIKPVKPKKKKRRIKEVVEDEEDQDDDDQDDDDQDDDDQNDDDQDDDDQDDDDQDDEEDDDEEPRKLKRLDQEIKSQRVIDLGSSSAKAIVRLSEPFDCYLSLAEVGLDKSEPLPILETSLGIVRKGKVFITSDQIDSETNKISVEVTFEREVVGGYVLNVEVATS